MAARHPTSFRGDLFPLRRPRSFSCGLGPARGGPPTRGLTDRMRQDAPMDYRESRPFRRRVVKRSSAPATCAAPISEANLTLAELSWPGRTCPALSWKRPSPTRRTFRAPTVRRQSHPRRGILPLKLPARQSRRRRFLRQFGDEPLRFQRGGPHRREHVQGRIGAGLRDAVISGVPLSYSNLSRADISGTDFEDAELTGR